MSRQAHNRRIQGRRVLEPKLDAMGVSVPRCVHTKVSMTNAVSGAEEVPGRGVLPLSSAKGVRSGGADSMLRFFRVFPLQISAFYS